MKNIIYVGIADFLPKSFKPELIEKIKEIKLKEFLSQVPEKEMIKGLFSFDYLEKYKFFEGKIKGYKVYFAKEKRKRVPDIVYFVEKEFFQNK